MCFKFNKVCPFRTKCFPINFPTESLMKCKSNIQWIWLISKGGRGLLAKTVGELLGVQIQTAQLLLCSHLIGKEIIIIKNIQYSSTVIHASTNPHFIGRDVNFHQREKNRFLCRCLFLLLVCLRNTGYTDFTRWTWKLTGMMDVLVIYFLFFFPPLNPPALVVKNQHLPLASKRKYTADSWDQWLVPFKHFMRIMKQTLYHANIVDKTFILREGKEKLFPIVISRYVIDF